MNVILIAVISLGSIGLISAIILYVASKKFAVYEDPKISQVSAVLPQANCGGCGYPGCSGFAKACVQAAESGSLEGKLCTVGGAPVMEKVASILGLQADAVEPRIAVVRCNGSCENRPRIAEYDGVRSCAIAHATSGGETACTYGCLGCGDCVAACKFDAIHMNPETGLPEVSEDKCVACGACAKACPRNIIEIRKKGPKGRRMIVECVNHDKGAVTNKACAVGCIACGKCEKVCNFGAIIIENNVSYIDAEKCKMCRKCEEVCPKHTIHAVNFPPRKPKPAVEPEATKVTANTERPVPVASKAVAPQSVERKTVAESAKKPVEAKSESVTEAK
ncbi:MAG: Fe-S cluster domain-containing protein [Phocaeicola sp.]|uniref:Fe-S cluster domain-containing protein n=1 Tax=Phocaeicola sp. TaxID=2773926 RepID=UPI003FA03645